jgi:hypothetical protein
VALRYAGGKGKKPRPSVDAVPTASKRKKKRSSRYTAHKEIIIAAFQNCRGNLSALERLLLAQGFRCSRRWLGIYLKEWGLKPDR